MSGRLTFHIARAFRSETALGRRSVAPEAILRELEGRSVALVGNARSLSQGNSGHAIDTADIVIRINRAPMPVDPHAWQSAPTGLRLRPPSPPPISTASARNASSGCRPSGNACPISVATSPGFYLHPLPRHRAPLPPTLGAPPTTGLMMIDLLARQRPCPARPLRLRLLRLAVADRQPHRRSGAA